MRGKKRVGWGKKKNNCVVGNYSYEARRRAKDADGN